MSPFFRDDNRLALENDRPRMDAPEKTTGKAKYTTDYYPANLIYASYIRSPYGNATVTAANTDAAKAVPGILEVAWVQGPDGADRKTANYPGDRLGYIVGESRQAIEDAMIAIKLKFEIDKPKVNLEREAPKLEATIRPDAPSGETPAPAQGGRRGGRRGGPQFPTAAEVAALDPIFSAAKFVHEAIYETQVQTHNPLEVHNGLVDVQGDKAMAWASTQGTFAYRDGVARSLEMSPEAVELHCEYVGGGFGAKLQGAGPDGDLAARMSKQFKRPCRVLLTRKEEQLDAGMRPGSRQYFKVAVGADNKIAGARLYSAASVGPTGGGGNVNYGNRYNLGQVVRSHIDVAMNSGFPLSFRAPGHPQAMFGMELMMDEVAAKAGIDPLKFRMDHDADPVRQEMYKAGAEMIGWAKRTPNGSQKGPIKTGLGIGVGDWGNGAGRATVTVNIYPTGVVEVLNGAQDIGTGFRTMLADCVASRLGVPRDFIVAKVGVSSLPMGPSSGGSTTSRSVAPRALGAAEQAQKGILEVVAKEWAVEPAKLKLEAGTISGGGKTIAFKDACKLITANMLTYTVSDGGTYDDRNTGSQAVQFGEVAVDVETGIVRVKRVFALQELGQAVNRMTAENQICGSIIQGISFALFEDRILNAANGAMVNPNLEMYKIAGSMDIPEIKPVIWQSQEGAAVNSLGEPPSVPICGMLACAIYNAIGVPVRTMPMTPRRVLAALAGAKGATA